MNLASASIGQVLVPVDDFDRGVAFYRDVLGLPFLFAAPPRMAFFACGDVRLLVGVVPLGQAAQRGSAIYFRVADIEAVHATLAALGVKFAAQPHPVHRMPASTLWLAEFNDPDGNALALMCDLPTQAS
jgi:methylmalonyl-CoA/ethylmalonyl-CoA epimerase